jgi:hypothetical protein
MRTIRRSPARAVVLLSSVLALATTVGCGGSGGSHGPSGLSAPSPFVGQWAGQWSGSDGNYGGITATVAASGKMTVSLNEVDTGSHGAGEGSIQQDGRFTVNYQFASGPPMNGTGTLTTNTSQGLVGTMALRRGAEAGGSANLDLHKM